MRPQPQLPRQNCPAGATFSEPSLRKSVVTFPLKIQKAASARADSPQEMIFRLGTLEREVWKL
jgi:hypothetical protein